MINQFQDAIILAAGIVVLCAVVVLIVLAAMTVYFELLARAHRRTKSRYERRLRQARDLHEDDLALERAWRQYVHDTGLEHATRGDHAEFIARMRESS